MRKGKVKAHEIMEREEGRRKEMLGREQRKR